MKKEKLTNRQLSPSEKLELIRLVEKSSNSVRKTLEEIQIAPSTFYRWYAAFSNGELQGLNRKKPLAVWNQLLESEKELIKEMALKFPERSAREIAFLLIDLEDFFVSESTVYRFLKSEDLLAAPLFRHDSAKAKFDKTTEKVNQLWQTDFTYFKVIHWGYYYLCTVLDDYSRYIIAWDLHPGMEASHAELTVAKALINTRISKEDAPKLLSDNGPCFIANDFKEFLETKGIHHIRGRPYHPQTQGKIERYHRSIKNVILLDVYHSPAELIFHIQQFVDYYNNQRYHESLDNCTPADVFSGRKEEVLKRRANLKRIALEERKARFKRNKKY